MFKTTILAPKNFSIDAAIVSVISELESVSSLKGEQITALKASLDQKGVITHWSGSLISLVEVSPSWTVIDRCFTQYTNYFFKGLPLILHT